ncbi:hypothetical protein IE53DRAFT_382776 [Violaceomyces palustris]|uniref:Uncharacterized protein n=1 Tax=Violaceomyces palustris TaxID=1673888 RepID=A0ACD0NL78_9BASI|nr:hypothetical protein IE53DRAFT_382776 [Violaceomyces palustris]
MNGLILPVGSDPPHRSPPSPSSPVDPFPPVSVKQEGRQEQRVAFTHPSDQQLSAPSTFPHQTNSTTGPPPPLRSPTTAHPASLAFIPRTSRTSAGIRKPLNQYKEFELVDLLATHEAALKSQTNPSRNSPTAPLLQARIQAEAEKRQRLLKRADEIRNELETRRNVRHLGHGLGRWRLQDSSDPPGAKRDLSDQMSRLTVGVAAGSSACCSSSSSSSPAAAAVPGEHLSYGYDNDTLSVKKQLVEESSVHNPKHRVQQLSYAHSVALQSAALAAEMELEKKAEASRNRALQSKQPPHLTLAQTRPRRLARSSGPTSPARIGPCPGFGRGPRIRREAEARDPSSPNEAETRMSPCAIQDPAPGPEESMRSHGDEEGQGAGEGEHESSWDGHPGGGGEGEEGEDDDDGCGVDASYQADIDIDSD